MAELALAYEEENEREREQMESGRREAFDKEMEARVKAMNLSVAPEEIEGAFEEVREVSKRRHLGSYVFILKWYIYLIVSVPKLRKYTSKSFEYHTKM